MVNQLDGRRAGREVQDRPACEGQKPVPAVVGVEGTPGAMHIEGLVLDPDPVFGVGGVEEELFTVDHDSELRDRRWKPSRSQFRE